MKLSLLSFAAFAAVALADVTKNQADLAKLVFPESLRADIQKAVDAVNQRATVLGHTLDLGPSFDAETVTIEEALLEWGLSDSLISQQDYATSHNVLDWRKAID